MRLLRPKSITQAVVVKSAMTHNSADNGTRIGDDHVDKSVPGHLAEICYLDHVVGKWLAGYLIDQVCGSTSTNGHPNYLRLLLAEICYLDHVVEIADFSQ